ncbi:hypothetical protein T265_04131 [Opisthorchis viverrini]|uniref:C2H2-type domain-containing protein n=1 Tax=Opisthorchis viverrini TaxID=6198 RepID=A0A074ZP81_OPIVI|nr:hypothetical protein T265_04131 [Opisthorchis viverrini]KER29198.1 hypothetical protein T265_04131 [Opisthorchis viverrini]
MSSNKSETRVHCFPLVWTHRNNYARTGTRPFKRESIKKRPNAATDHGVDVGALNHLIVLLARWTVHQSGVTRADCGRCCSPKTGFVALRRIHVYESFSTNMVTLLVCADCSHLYATKTGLSQQCQHAHPT